MSVTTQQAVWLFPICVAVHFLEEATGFASWAGRNISSRYTASHWSRVHAIGMVLAIAASASVDRWMHPLTIFFFTATFLTPMVFNALFHAAASMYFRSYSPGTLSALLLFPALCWYLASRFDNVAAWRGDERHGCEGRSRSSARRTCDQRLRPRRLLSAVRSGEGIVAVRLSMAVPKIWTLFRRGPNTTRRSTGVLRLCGQQRPDGVDRPLGMEDCGWQALSQLQQVGSKEVGAGCTRSIS